MTTIEPAYAATEQHIRFLAEKQRRLAEAQIEAEKQLIQAVARETKQRAVPWQELLDLYLRLKEFRQPGFQKRWDAQLPTLLAIKGSIKWLEERGEPGAESWVGSYPFPAGEPRPGSGICVVYVLFDHGNQPCYVGSTSAFRERLWGHRTDGKNFVRWQAHRCRDREHAYEVETQFLQQYKPYLNKRASR